MIIYWFLKNKTISKLIFLQPLFVNIIFNCINIVFRKTANFF